MYTSIFTWVTLLSLTWQIFNYKHASSNFLPGTLQASKYKYIQHTDTGDLTTFTSKINNIYVNVSFSFCLIIFVWTRFKFLYNKINFQINTSLHQLTQHGFIRCMGNDIHDYLQVLKQKQMKQPFKTICLAFPQDLKQKHMKQPFKTICLVLPQYLKQKHMTWLLNQKKEPQQYWTALNETTKWNKVK